MDAQSVRVTKLSNWTRRAGGLAKGKGWGTAGLERVTREGSTPYYLDGTGITNTRAYRGESETTRRELGGNW